MMMMMKGLNTAATDRERERNQGAIPATNPRCKPRKHALTHLTKYQPMITSTTNVQTE